MSRDGLKMVVHFGEADRAGRRLLSGALMDLFGARRVLASALLRGVEGFGIKHRLRTDRLLSLSEDLPLLAVAVDAVPAVERLVPEVAAMVGEGLVTLERVALPGALPGEQWPGSEGDHHAKLTVWCGRGAARCGRPVPALVLLALREAGLPGATVLAGVDGTLAGERRRARMASRNRGVPALVLSVGPREAYADVLPRLRELLPAEHVLTLERVHVVRRDGRVLRELPTVPARDPSGLAMWRRVTVVAGESERWEGRPLHEQLIRRLREAGAAGATALRGVMGYSGDGPLHADRLLAVRRRTPVLVTLIDAVDEVARLWPLVARATSSSGLVTCEVVPAFRATGPAGRVGGLRLADVAGAGGGGR